MAIKLKYTLLALLVMAPAAYAVDIDAPAKEPVDKKAHCIKSIGNKKLCECIAKNLPGDVSFAEYIEFFALTPQELDVKTLSADGKALYAQIKNTHDQCVKK
jgi:hypothetical protein